MNKQSFLNELELLLARMSPDERQDVLYDYQEHIQAAMESGKSEEDAVKALGSPKTIAKELLADYYIGKAEAAKTPKNVLRAVVATISLGFFNLVFMIGPIVGLIGVLIGFFGASIALIVAPVASVLAIAIGIGSADVPFMAALFPFLACVGAGLMLMALSIFLGKWLSKLLIRYARFNVRVISGGN